ncbi:hypothetical protein TPA0909_55380 [Streptomyces albus]|nr:hypothetical protein TPA0909_55380 [Streptomyces albus]
MLEAVGHPHAVNPDRALRKEALARDWPVLTFSRPVRPQAAHPLAVHAVHGRALALTAVAVGAAAATAGLVWFNNRRRSAVQPPRYRFF